MGRLAGASFLLAPGGGCSGQGAQYAEVPQDGQLAWPFLFLTPNTGLLWSRVHLCKPGGASVLFQLHLPRILLPTWCLHTWAIQGKLIIVQESADSRTELIHCFPIPHFNNTQRFGLVSSVCNGPVSGQQQSQAP